MTKYIFINKLLKLHTLLFFLGAVLWFKFIFSGNPDYNNFDWIVLNQWLGVIKLSFEEQKIPYYATFFREEIETGKLIWGNKFFSIPYLITSPQILFLKITSLKFFYGIHFFFTYIISFYFYIKWVSYLRLKILAAIFLFLGLFFSGPLVGRISVGHLQLTAYFLVPGFLYVIWNIYNSSNFEFTLKYFIKYYFPLVGLLIYSGAQGSLHVLQQWLIVGTLVLITKPKRLLFFFISFILAVCCLIHIFIPNLLFGSYISDITRGYQTGFIYQIINVNYDFIYRPFLIIINNILNIFPMLISKVDYRLDASWEVSLYVGYAYLLIMLYSIMKYLKHKKINWNVLIIFLLIFFSCGGILIIYRIISYMYYFPLLDRLSVRLLIYPFFIIILLASDILNQINNRTKVYYLFVLLVFVASIELLLNFFNWRVSESSNTAVGSQIMLTGLPKIYESDSLATRSIHYEVITITCYILSIAFNAVFFVSWIYNYIKLNDRK